LHTVTERTKRNAAVDNHCFQEDFHDAQLG
jgi:hypothetical protein